MNCPVCGKGTIKIGNDKNGKPNRVYCSERKAERVGDEWINVGECNFQLFLNQEKIFRKTLSTAEMKKLLSGETIKNNRGDQMTFDKDSDYFTKVEFAPKKEDRDL